ncbi:type II toxin-antitoxin system HipA family toxin [Chitinimonas arctica]|uniref:Type II toxin-antitoxin system HipA family toxin n=1 Tax=Chitinimonas arctica TaxID=2594795 RepID=A0A516SFC6_9NEIS|nr:type II toxin-antitoxin system HipA family toxin [Chitinimonas arctica]QDQ26867.1 type II toxin-antitoxin system HipA family toxin [Chitinimonas arctica]
MVSATNDLDIWMNGEFVGIWHRPRHQPDTLIYDESWIRSTAGRPLSLSLPFVPGNAAHKGAKVANYFDNLLPDSERIRARVAARYTRGDESAFALLSAIGRDCVGAIQLMPDGQEPPSVKEINGEPLEEADVATVLRETTAAPGPFQRNAQNVHFRLSIAGAQEKTALLRHNNQWHAPLGSTPTTHIMKLPLGLVGGMRANMHDSVENEWLCSKIVEAYGIPVAYCDMAQFEDQKVLVVRRFDRRLHSSGSWIMRLPQEDMCQATGTPAGAKYQNDGGPGITKIMSLLAGSVDPITAMETFFLAQIVFYLLAATDGHAKNFSIATLPDDAYAMTPIYDVLSAHPIIGAGANMLQYRNAKLAMAIRGSTNYYELSRIRDRHFVAHAKQTQLGEVHGRHLVDKAMSMLDGVIEVVTAQLPASFPVYLAEAVFDGMRQQRRRLASAAIGGDV